MKQDVRRLKLASAEDEASSALFCYESSMMASRSAPTET